MDNPGETTEHSPNEVFWTAVLFEISLGGLALLLGWLFGPDARHLIPPLDWTDLGPIWRGLVYGLLASAPLVGAIEIIKRIPWKPIQELDQLADDGMLRKMLSLSTGELIAISLCAGVGEELLFRGWLFPWMAGGTLEVGPAEIAIAMIGSSIAFGLVHPITKFYVVMAAVMGSYFALLLVWTGNLLVPIIAHAVYDSVQLIMTAREHQHQPDNDAA